MGQNKNGREILSRGSGASLAFAKMCQKGNFKKAIVYIEGESDVILYKKIIDKEYAELSQTRGKAAAMSTIKKANLMKQKGLLAIVDSDFDHILNIGPDENVIRTDTHDIETLMIESGAFDDVPDGFIDERKLNNSIYNEESLWERIIDIASCIGKIRLLSAENGWNMKFADDNSNKDFLDDERIIYLKDGELKFDAHQYIWKCINNAVRCSITVRDAYECYKNDNRAFDIWQICRGHDLSELIALVYSRTIFGKRNVYRTEVENTIRAVYIKSRKFGETKMCDDIKNWQSANESWKVLSDAYMS